MLGAHFNNYPARSEEGRYEPSLTSKSPAGPNPEISVALTLSSNIYHRAMSDVSMILTVTTTLDPLSSKPVTLDGRGDLTCAATILRARPFLDMDHFTFTDTSTGVQLPHHESSPTCDSGEDVLIEEVHVLYPGKPHITSHPFNKLDSETGPLDAAISGHEYKISLIPQEMGWQWSTTKEVFGEAKFFFFEDFKGMVKVKLESDDHPTFRVEL